MINNKYLNRIVGSGFLANHLKTNEELFKKLNIYAYAAGISNSQCTDNDLLEIDKKRVFNFKNEIDQKEMIVYFSTCSIDDPSRSKTPYVKNKLIIEDFIKKNFKKYLIIRFPELVGVSKNKTTLINFFFDRVKNNISFDLWANARRNLIGVDDALIILVKILKKRDYENTVMNIANPKSFLVTDIIEAIEELILKKAKYHLVEKGDANWKIDISKTFQSIKSCNIDFNNNYLKNILKKYFI
jgi:nucleoside-diphosphate-sugar epimerase